MMQDDTETLTLGEELDRLKERQDTLLDALDDDVELDDESDEGVIQSEANDVEQAGPAISHLANQYGPDATITVRGLSAGEQARLLDRIQRKCEQQNQESLPGYRRNVFAAGGLIDAPFLDERDPDLETKLLAITDQKPGVAVWLRNVVNDKTTLDEGNWTPLVERLVERRSN